MTINVRRVGWPGRRVVVDASPLHEGPVALRRRVVDREHEPREIAEQWLDHCGDELRGDRFGLLSGRRDGDVTRLELR